MPIDAEELQQAKESEAVFHSKVSKLPSYEEQVDNLLFYLDGGNSGGCMIYSSLLADAIFMNSFYQEAGREMVVKSLPMADGSGYVANITGMGFSFAKAENLNAVYKLLRYLMDYEFSIPYGFSVNRANTEKQFEIAEKTSYEIIFDQFYAFYATDEQIQAQIVHLSPLNEKYCKEVQQLLGQIKEVSLPQYEPMVMYFTDAVLKTVRNEFTMEEAYENLQTQMKDYVRDMQ